MPDTTDYRYTYRTSLSMTDGMHERLREVVAARRDPKFKTADAIREALRYYLDHQEDLIGSRQHFSKSLKLSLNHHEQTILFMLHVLILLVARLFVYLVKTNDGRNIDPLVVIESAIVESRKLSKQINEITAKTKRGEKRKDD